jgi:hypothetical protein
MRKLFLIWLVLVAGGCRSNRQGINDPSASVVDLDDATKPHSPGAAGGHDYIADAIDAMKTCREVLAAVKSEADVADAKPKLAECATRMGESQGRAAAELARRGRKPGAMEPGRAQQTLALRQELMSEVRRVSAFPSGKDLVFALQNAEAAAQTVRRTAKPGEPVVKALNEP